MKSKSLIKCYQFCYCHYPIVKYFDDKCKSSDLQTFDQGWKYWWFDQFMDPHRLFAHNMEKKFHCQQLVLVVLYPLG